MADTITITLGADTLVFTTKRKRRVAPEVEPAIVSQETDGQAVYTYDKANDVVWHPIEFPDKLTQTEADFLDDFFANVCRGRLNEFTFTDEDGTDHTVLWWAPKKFACRYVADGAYSCPPILFREGL